MMGGRIGALRRARGFSQAELARRLKISASAMGMYEQGRREPAAQILVALSRELGVSTDFLLTGQAVSAGEATLLEQMLGSLVESADARLSGRPDRPFTRQDLVTLFAALLME